MNEENQNLTEKKLPTEDAKNALMGALKGIPKSFLLKVICFIHIHITGWLWLSEWKHMFQHIRSVFDSRE